MKFLSISLPLVVLSLFAATRTGDLARISHAAQVLHEFMSAPDGIPPKILGEAECVAILPGIQQVGSVGGTSQAQGVLVCREGRRWSPPSLVIMRDGSSPIGAGADVVVVVQNKSAESTLLQDNCVITFTTGAMAGPVGKTAKAETAAQRHADFLTYSRSRGVVAGADLGGAVVEPDNDANRRIYRRPLQQREILTNKMRPPAIARALYAELDRNRCSVVISPGGSGCIGP
jgi:SH3 domain-containing YSC84-like protein 1